MDLLDPYHEWFSIPPAEQPPNHYRLLGIPLLEENQKVITNAYYRQMSFLKTKQLGTSRVVAEQLMNELTAAHIVLLDSAKRLAYNQTLPSEIPAAVVAPPHAPPELNFGSPSHRTPKPKQRNKQGRMALVQFGAVIFGGVIAISCAIGLLAMLGMDPLGLMTKKDRRQVAEVSPERKKSVAESVPPIKQQPIRPEKSPLNKSSQNNSGVPVGPKASETVATPPSPPRSPPVVEHVIGTPPTAEMTKQPAQASEQPKPGASRSLTDLLPPDKIPTTPATPADGRTRWSYDDGEFQRQADGSWKQLQDGKTHQYRELGRTGEYIEMEHFEKKGRLKLYENRSEIDLTLTGTYVSHGWNGKWVAENASPLAVQPPALNQIASSPVTASAASRLPAGKELDLLAMVKLPDHAVMGNWKRIDAAVVCEAFPSARFMAPVVVTGSYEIRCKFVRRTGKEYIALIIPVGGAHCSIMIDRLGGKKAAIGRIDGKDHADVASPPTGVTKAEPIMNGIGHDFVVNVTQTGAKLLVKASLDGKQFSLWRGVASQLQLNPADALPHPLAFGFAANESITDVQELKLTLGKDATGYQLGDDWQTPLTEVANSPSPQIAPMCLAWNAKKFFISEKPMSLPDAQRLALAMKGRLLTISSAEENEFFLKNGRGLNYWMAGWRPPVANLSFRDERNRPLRYLGQWHNFKKRHFIGGNRYVWVNVKNPDHAENREWQLEIATGEEKLLWNDIPMSASKSQHACIEWGEEYP